MFTQVYATFGFKKHWFEFWIQSPIGFLLIFLLNLSPKRGGEILLWEKVYYIYTIAFSLWRNTTKWKVFQGGGGYYGGKAVKQHRYFYVKFGANGKENILEPYSSYIIIVSTNMHLYHDFSAYFVKNEYGFFSSNKCKR